MKDAPETREPEGERRCERGREEHKTLQRRRMSRLPFPEKLQRLERAQRTLRTLQAKRPCATGG